jgi:tRNA dimethylallyltransferase
MPDRIAVITGPTAAGKTALGVELALQLNGEVVSADSMQLYRGMDIGTAKPTAAEMRGVPHHMLSVADPRENYSAARYAAEAARCVDDILARGRLPIVVGGTGLYIDALIAGRAFAAPGNDALRAQLGRGIRRPGGRALPGPACRRWTRTGPSGSPPGTKSAWCGPWRSTWSPAGPSRPRRGVEAAAEALRGGQAGADLPGTGSALCPHRPPVDEMAARGLAGEVARLLSACVSPPPAPPCRHRLQGDGRRPGGGISPDEAIERIKRESRRYAKRQLTWLRRDASLEWLYWERSRF